MRRGRTTLKKRGTAGRTRLNYEDVKQDDGDLQDDDFIRDAAQGLQRHDGSPLPTEKELEEFIERTLTVSNPQSVHNSTFFSFKERVFKRQDQIEQMVVHFSLDGCLLLKDSDEAGEQEDFTKFKKNEGDELLKATAVEEGFPIKLDYTTQLRSLRNQFNYAERTSQAFTSAIKECGVSTEPPPTRSFAGTINQWDVYDSYITELSLQKPAQPAASDKKRRRVHAKTSTAGSSLAFTAEMGFAVKIMERMVNQNDLQVNYNSFKYVDLYSDQIRGNEGSLNELWTFVSKKTKKKEVTAIVWNPVYHDLFAVGYGFYGFMKKGSGLICCYSLKNTRYPEYHFITPKGVMCLDWHPQNPSLLAVGLYDGTVLVYDVRAKHKKPIYQSTVRNHKHTDPVWQVKWQDVDPLKNLSFFSVSSDGRVTNWVLMKNKLEPEEVIKLKLVASSKDGEEDDTALSGLAGGTCFDFSPFQDHLFLVGTEEGKIHLCNKVYNSQYLDTYDAHFMAVYSVKWNKFHTKIFLSASADWTVKMWDYTAKTPLLTFDLGIAVGDVSWAPYSSTIFSAITADSKCHIYDIKVNKLSEICDKKMKSVKLNHIAFNPTQPIVLIGNEKGYVLCYKLSQNLRKTEILTEEDEEKGLTLFQKELNKLEEVLQGIDSTIY